MEASEQLDSAPESPQEASGGDGMAPLGSMKAQPIAVGLRTRRSGDDALLGSWVDVIAGEHQGRKGHYFEDSTHAPDGYPEMVFIRTRDADNLVIEVLYADIRPSEYTGGR